MDTMNIVIVGANLSDLTEINLLYERKSKNHRIAARIILSIFDRGRFFKSVGDAHCQF